MDSELEKIQKHLGYLLDEETRKFLKENDIDFDAFIGLMGNQDFEKKFNIKVKNKNDAEVERIQTFLNTIKVDLSDESIFELRKRQVTFENFLKLNRFELEALKFKIGSVQKILKNKGNASNESRIVGLKKFLTTTKNEKQQQQQLEEAFSNIILGKLDRTNLIACLCSGGGGSFMTKLKPYLFDMLKRNQKFDKIVNEIFKLVEDDQRDEFMDERMHHLISSNKDSLEILTERDLTVGLIESVGQISLPRLGYLVSKNDLPLPLGYYVYDERHQPDSFAYKINFDLFYDTLCLTDRSLALVTGTESTRNNGKSTLIPLMFPGLNKHSVYSIDQNTPRKDGIDMICNEETSEHWVIADFNGSLTVNLNIFKSMCAFASLHIVNVKLSDFDPNTGEPVDELKIQLDWHNILNCNTTAVIIFRDTYENEPNNLSAIRNYLTDNYTNVKFELVKVLNAFENSNTHKLTLIKTRFIDQIGAIMQKLKLKSMHSIFDIKSVYNELSRSTGGDVNNNNNTQKISTDVKYTRVELEFRRLFTFENNTKIDKLRSIFELSGLLKKIEQNEKISKKLFFSHDEEDVKRVALLEKQLDELKEQKTQIQPKNEYLQLFIDLLLENDQNYYVNLLIFEKCLLNFKRKELAKLKDRRKTLSAEYKELDVQLKQASGSNLSTHYKQLRKELSEVDEQIEILDLTLDKFWDEIFLYFDWLDENKKNDEQRETIIEKYVDLLNKGFSIHLLRGNPLKIQSSSMASVFSAITKHKNIYVICVIGEQSSAKSSLLNALFGCDFRTSAGRCTMGIYFNFVHYMDKTIAILDTEGLASIENSNSTFDNQMAAMAVFSSHMIIINHKGEISSNLENILGITFFAKLHLLKKSFKPSIVFILRDQTSKDAKNLQDQAAKLRERLIEKSKFISASLDDVMKIETDKLYLLSNAFSYDQDRVISKEVKWRNDVFPDEVLELRRSLMDQLASIDVSQTKIYSFADLYAKMCSYWETIKEAGENIFNFKDLEEIKIRNEICFKANELIEKHRNRFADELNNLLGEELLKLEANYDDESFTLAKARLDSWYVTTLHQVIQTYDEQTNISYYSESIKKEFRNRIEYQFNWIKESKLNKLKENSTRIKNMDEFNQMNRQIIDQINDLLKKSISAEDFMSLVREKFDQIDRINTKRLDELRVPLKSLIRQILKFYDENLNVLRGVNKNFITFKQINDLEQFYEEKKINMDQWINRSGNGGNVIKRFFDKFWSGEETNNNNNHEKIYSNQILPQFPKLKSRDVSRSLINELIYLVYDSLCRLDHKINFVNVLNDIMKLTLCQMIDEIRRLQDENLQLESAKYESFKLDLFTKAEQIFRLKNDSRQSGEYSGGMFFDHFYEYYETRELLSVNNVNNEIIQNHFKSPNDLIEFAFKSSFDVGNYENVYKYATDVNRYCMEVCIKSIKPEVEINIRDKQRNFRVKFKKMMQFLHTELNAQLARKKSESTVNCEDDSVLENWANLSSSYELIDRLQKQIELDVELCEFHDILGNVKYKLCDIQVDMSLFMSGFEGAIMSKLTNIEETMSRLENEFGIRAKQQVKRYIEEYLGCNATCPGCGSKCQNAKGHEGNHCSNKHIIDGFNGWREKDTNKIVTYFCWEDTKFLRVKVTHKDTYEYASFKVYLETVHQNWLFDVEENYHKWGKIGSSKDRLVDNNFKRAVIKAWMNTRMPLLGDRIDKQYEQDWLNLENKDKMLNVNFQPIWEDQF